MSDVTVEIAADMGNTSATINDATTSIDGLGDAASSASGDLNQADSDAGGRAAGGRVADRKSVV